MKRSCLALLILGAAGCSGPDPTAPGVAPPTPTSSAPAPALSPPVAADASPPAPGARPLSERGAHALSIDLMQRTNDAFDGRYPGPASAVVDDTFVVIAGDPSAPLDAAVKVTRETVDALWGGPFVHKPELAVVLWVSSSQAQARTLMRYRAPGLRSDGLGLYDSGSRQIFVAADPSGWGTTRHECVHPLLRADFPHAPAWLLEGLPGLFEVAEIDGNALRFGAHFRLETLRTALHKPGWADQVKLDTLFTWESDEAFRKNEALHYGVAREALRWLHSQGLLWPFYTAWRDGVLDDPTGEKAFQAVVHKSPAEASEAWVAWLQSEEAEGMVPAVVASEHQGRDR